MNDTGAPRIYAEWLPLLERFQHGDDSALAPMRKGTIEWTNVVAERWTSRLAEVTSSRLRGLSQQLQLELNRSAGDSFAVARAMLGARRSLIPLFALASLPCAPAEVQAHLREELERFVKQTQSSLERGAEEHRTDNGRLVKLIRDNSLTVPPEADIAMAGAEPPPAETPVARSRRVIL